MNDLNNRLLVLLGIFACVVSAFLLGSYGGFSFGSYLCDAQYPIIGQLGWVSDLDPYITNFNSQRSVTILLLLLVGIQFVKYQWLSLSVGLACALVSLIFMIRIVSYKYKFWDEQVPYLRMERELIVYDLVIVLFIAVILMMFSWILIQKLVNHRYKSFRRVAADIDDA